MNHAVVFAAQQYLGFELCRALLERGWTVTAVDDEAETTDKWLEIGRNANIQYIPAEEWDRELPVECRLFLPYYDQIGGRSLQCLSPSVIGKIKSGEDGLPEIVRVFPNQTERSNSTKSSNEASATFYLPTLYGGHQPSHFLFAQLLEGERENESRYEDDRSGAIYVKDAAVSILKHSGSHGTFSLRPLSENSWEEALSYITEDSFSSFKKERSMIGEPIIVHPTKSHESILKEQKLVMNSF
ncbi:hypothetical protein [Rossellomorea aquimaris]|uniref:Uncharacterized protein n=1 Tax=Rossellomorea aquimaris TaxID=189382 RepID=A0A1J6W4L5_9BACI|nr:hypothetical protein [Rossellomorea aquimaris]OIU72522.1 hypothetical protein BHE18_07840 [Rossellomorea aquimaris]